ncbi:MAG: YlbF family regulator [Clostridiales bacterium]|jgi:cell fate (sporulation/competence/biofilm development) regulator YlbF (YheA/YmcA/DUF963 family)|nr:YlbF family regulator [Clostridiales bacterium]
MDEITGAAQKLADALRESGLYKDYRKSKIRVTESPEISGRLLAFKKKQSLVETKRLQGQPVAFEEEKELSHLYAELSQSETARDFLLNEEAFLDAYRRMADILTAACEIDLY